MRISDTIETRMVWIFSAKVISASINQGNSVIYSEIFRRIRCLKSLPANHSKRGIMASSWSESNGASKFTGAYSDAHLQADFNLEPEMQPNLQGWQIASKCIQMALNNRVEDALKTLRSESKCVHRQAGYCYLTFIVRKY